MKDKILNAFRLIITSHVEKNFDYTISDHEEADNFFKFAFKWSANGSSLTITTKPSLYPLFKEQILPLFKSSSKTEKIKYGV